jgi:MoaA/NifB/PqqE/SkfB family radical SAM enzyme
MEDRNTTSLAWDHWHIEASSICSLRCPRCPRTEVPESLLNKSLSLDFFQNQIGAEIIKKIKKITFCGNDGDPIYCKQFLEICQWIKEQNNRIELVIITNGSYKKPEWWKQLALILNENDEIHWSIDGINQTTNEIYRVNSNWESIISGVDAFFQQNDSTYRTWATIAFSFNEHSLQQQKQFAQDIGFDHYQLTKSTKFGSKYSEIYGQDDPLEPTDSTLIAEGHRFERLSYALTSKPKPGEKLKQVFFQRAANLAKHNTHSGICLIGNKGVFLNSQGEFYPCCWVANRYEHNKKWHKMASGRFNLNDKTFTEILKDSYWYNEFLEFDSFECKYKCTPEKLSDSHHTTEW